MSAEGAGHRPLWRVWLVTTAALLGFAANSVFCRLALADKTIDPASFTAIRLGSGAAMLNLLVALRAAPARARSTVASWPSAFALFAYAAAFSLAYTRLSAGVGALLLFGLVQVTMLVWGLRTGEQFGARQGFGLLLAAGGLIALLAPGLRAPDPLGAALMGLAGIAWGVYSIRGKGVVDPLATTASNFRRSLPFATALLLSSLGDHHVTMRGVWLALASGAIASGLAYSLWYAALRHLLATQAAVLQLSVPVLAATGGVLLLAEPLTARLLAAGASILVGVAVAVRRSRP